MVRVTRAVVVVALFLFSSSVRAQGAGFDGNKLLEECEDAVSESEEKNISFLLVYVLDSLKGWSK